MGIYGGDAAAAVFSYHMISEQFKETLATANGEQPPATQTHTTHSSMDGASNERSGQQPLRDGQGSPASPAQSTIFVPETQQHEPSPAANWPHSTTRTQQNSQSSDDELVVVAGCSGT